MNRTALIIVSLALLAGCHEQHPTGGKITNIREASERGASYGIVEIDGCEYIEVSYGLGSGTGYYSLTHKGNCKNPIHSEK